MYTQYKPYRRHQKTRLLWQQPVLLQELHFQTTMKDSGGDVPMKMHVMINYVCITKHARALTTTCTHSHTPSFMSYRQETPYFSFYIASSTLRPCSKISSWTTSSSSRLSSKKSMATTHGACWVCCGYYSCCH